MTPVTSLARHQLAVAEDKLDRLVAAEAEFRRSLRAAILAFAKVHNEVSGIRVDGDDLVVRVLDEWLEPDPYRLTLEKRILTLRDALGAAEETGFAGERVPAVDLGPVWPPVSPEPMGAA